MEKEVLIRSYHLLQIVIADWNATSRLSYPQLSFQHFRRSLKINYQIGCGNLSAKMIVILVVNFEFGIAQVDASKDLVFLEDVVRNHCSVAVRPHVQAA